MRWAIWIFFALQASACTNLVYQPSRDTFYEPHAQGYVQPEEVWFASEGGPKLHGWWFPTQASSVEGTVIQFHGNAENMTSHFLSLVWVLKAGYNLFAFDYRGYGRSEGAPYPAGVHVDALAALDLVSERVDNAERSVIVYGQSLGGTIALRALGNWNKQSLIRAVVVEGSFLSYKRIARQKLSELWLTWPFQWMAYLLVSNEYGPERVLERLEGLPLLVVHGTGDRVIPIAQGRQIYDAVREPKCFWPIEAPVHTGLMNWERGKHRSRMLRFFRTRQCPKGEG